MGTPRTAAPLSPATEGALPLYNSPAPPNVPHCTGRDGAVRHLRRGRGGWHARRRRRQQRPGRARVPCGRSPRQRAPGHRHGVLPGAPGAGPALPFLKSECELCGPGLQQSALANHAECYLAHQVPAPQCILSIDKHHPPSHACSILPHQANVEIGKLASLARSGACQVKPGLAWPGSVCVQSTWVVGRLVMVQLCAPIKGKS